MQIIGLPSPHDHLNGKLGIVSKVIDDKYHVRFIDGSGTQKFGSKHLEKINTSAADDEMARAVAAANKPKMTFHGDDLAAALASGARAAKR